jgi:hypothetical protein
MATIIVLFNLKEGTVRQDYEDWAATTDLPVVRGLASVGGYDIFRSTGLFGSDDSAPYQYIEMITVNDMALFTDNIGEELMTKVAAEFQAFADAPQFLMTEKLG